MTLHSQKKSTALSYDPAKDAAPKVLAQGSGAMAFQMIRVAEAHGVAVVADPDLCALTSVLPVNSEIPENLYTAIAGLLGMLLKARHKKQSASNPK